MAERAAGERALGGMPVGRRTRRGTGRWYLVHAPGREQATCERVRRLVAPGLLDDAFVMRKERIDKHGGRWGTTTVPMYPGYFFVVTRDAGALDRELARLCLPARIARSEGGCYAPMARQAQAWYERMMDATHTIRASTAVLEGSALHVQAGPLVGQEALVTRVDRHRCLCEVRVGEGDGAFSERVPVAVPLRT